MVPYIIAENPDVSSKEAFRLSKEMMMNNKWKMFKLDIIIQRIPFRLTVFICVILCIMFVIDIVFSLGNPNMGKGITVTLNLINT